MKTFKVRPLHIIMAMAGEGSRFKEAGYTVPKPLIKVEGIELFRRAIGSFNYYCTSTNIPDTKYTFIVRSEYISEYEIDKTIKMYYPNANILAVEKTTRGALETLMVAKDYIDDDDCVVSMDCDIQFNSSTYDYKILHRRTEDSAIPMVMSFYSKNPIYSFVKVVDGIGTYVAEKDPISNYALGGCYYLGLGKNLKKAAKQYIKDFEDGKIQTKELYLSLVINYIANITKKTIEVYDMNFHYDHYWSFGTPYDLEHYNYDRNIWDA